MHKKSLWTAVSLVALVAGSLGACAQPAEHSERLGTGISNHASKLQAVMAPIVNGGTIQEGRNPNTMLPPAVAPTSNCSSLNQIFEQQLSTTSAGRSFLAAQDTRADTSDQSAVMEHHKVVTDAWVAFVVDFWATQHEALAKAAADDEHARQALSALSDYAELAPDMLNGKIPQFLDEKQAQIDLASGKKPQVNPEFTTRSNKIATAIDHLSLCMPSWPVLF